MISHNVTFRLEGADAIDRANQFKAALEKLPALIPQLVSMEVGVDDSGISGNWTVYLRARCADYADLATYAAHPEHLACVAIIKPVIAARACVDFQE